MRSSPITARAARDGIPRPVVSTQASAHAVLSNRQRFLRACACEEVDRPPVWLMRQAGRVLPEYRELKERYSFTTLIQTPELATEVTLQPIRRFDFDAAILFSDILVIPEALGQSFKFREKGGVEMAFRIDSAQDVARLDPAGVAERLQYVGTAIQQTRAALGERTALIGFAGSPWTLANFMMEGGSSKEFTRAKGLFYTSRALFDELCEKLTAAITEFLQLQVRAGVDAVQIFDSLGGLLSGSSFEEASGRWMRQIIAALRGRVPVIVFARGAHGSLPALLDLDAQVLGVDWTVSLPSLRRHLPDRLAVQGNLDPGLLETTPEAVEAETKRILADLRGRPGHIFNLGHGVPPRAKLACIESLLTTVRHSHEHA